MNDDLGYNVQTRRYIIDGVPMTKGKATQLLHAEGLTLREARAILNIHRRCAERQSRLPPPAPEDAMSDDEFWRLFRFSVFRSINLCAARKWIADHLRPAKRPYRRGLYGLKHAFEWDGWGRYIRQGDFADLLAAQGIRVVGQRVYCTEIRS